MDSTNPHGNYRPEIDGLRAFAIAPVVLFHAGLGFPGGFVGVDVFFVISGFLIGGIILRELEEGRFSFANFWERRIRRIVPAILFFLAATLMAGWLILPAPELASLASQTTSALLGLANFKMRALTGGYWTTSANTIPLLHLWSLAVEEQFYLLTPAILVIAQRWLNRRTDAAMLALFAASLFLSLYWSANGDPANFYLLPSRGWELMLGCLGAWAIHRGMAMPKALRQLAPAVGLAGIVISSFVLRDDARWPDARTLLPTVGTLLVLISPTGSATARLLSIPPLRFLGLISYSLYLWHWPLIVFLRNYGPEEMTVADRWGVVAAAVGLAALSWFFVEQPFRNKTRRLRFATKPLLAGVAGAWVCLMAASVELAKAPPVNPATIMPGFFRPPGKNSITPYDATGMVASGGIQFNAEGQKPRCVLLGSSHGMMMGPVVRDLSDAHKIPCAIFSQLATSPLFVPTNPGSQTPRKMRDMAARDVIVKAYIKAWRPDVVILAAKWNTEAKEWGKGLGPAWPSFPEAVSNTIRWLSEHSGKVLVIGQVPQLPFQSADDVSTMIWRRYGDHGNVMPRLEELRAVTAERKAALALLKREAFSNVIVLDPTPLLENADGFLRYYGSDGLFYFDYNHLNSLGSKELRPLLEPFFQSMAASKN